MSSPALEKPPREAIDAAVDIAAKAMHELLDSLELVQSARGKATRAARTERLRKAVAAARKALDDLVTLALRQGGAQ